MNLLRALVGLAAFGLAAASGSAAACSSTASYRSVVINQPPDAIPEDAQLMHVRVDEALVAQARGEIQGIRATLLEPSGRLEKGSTIQIEGRLGSMCNTWIDNWSTDPDIVDGVISGFVVGRVVGAIGEAVLVHPMLYRRAVDRARTDPPYGWWLYARASRYPSFNRERYRPSPSSDWRTFRVDREAIVTNLERTNEAIRANLRKSQDEEQEQ